MAKPYQLATAKKSGDLSGAIDDVGDLLKRLKMKKRPDEEVIANAMSATKKPAEFLASIDIKDGEAKVDLYCEVAPKKDGGGKWVFGRSILTEASEVEVLRDAIADKSLDKKLKSAGF